MKVLAERMKWLREKNRLAQKEVAANIGVTLSGIQKMEYGTSMPKVETLVKIADFFDISTDFLLGRVSYTNDLNDVLSKIRELESELEMIKNEYAVTMMNISEIREKVLFNAKDKGFTDKETMMYTQMLDHKLHSVRRIEYKREDLKKELAKCLYQYFNSVIDIPGFKVKEDSILKYYLPIVEVRADLFDEFALQIFVEEIGLIGTYSIYETEEAAIKAKEKLIDKLEGKE